MKSFCSEKLFVIESTGRFFKNRVSLVRDCTQLVIDRHDSRGCTAKLSDRISKSRNYFLPATNFGGSIKETTPNALG